MNESVDLRWPLPWRYCQKIFGILVEISKTIDLIYDRIETMNIGLNKGVIKIYISVVGAI